MDYRVLKNASRECALIVAEEIGSMMGGSGKPETFTRQYWQKVKEEINNQ